MTTPNIYQRINSVMKEVQYVQKDKSITGGGANYKAVTHDQVVSVVRSSLVKHGIVIYPEQITGEFIVKRDLNATPAPVKMGLYEASYNIHFINIDNPEDKVTTCITAHANDNGDKAPGKCATYAVKTVVLKMFFLETGENDESRTEETNFDTISEAEQQQLIALMVDHDGNWTPKGSKVARAFKIQDFANIKSNKFNQILKAAQ